MAAAAAAAAGSGSGVAAGGAASSGTGAMIASGAAGALSSLVNLGLGIAGLVQSRNQYNQARADQMYYYEDQKNWNSPQNQMYLRALAGLNPYGDFVAASPGTPVPVENSASVNEALSMIGSGVSKGAQAALDALAQKLAFSKLHLEQKQVNLQEKLTDSQIRLISGQATAQDIANWVSEKTKHNKVSLSSAELLEAFSRALVGYNNFEWNDDLNRANFESIMEGIRRSEQSRDIDRQRFDYEKLGLEFDSSFYKSIDSILDSVDADPNLSHGVKAAIKGLFFAVKAIVSYKNSSKH